MIRFLRILGLVLVLSGTLSSALDATNEAARNSVTYRHEKNGATWQGKPRETHQSNALFKARLGARKESPAERNSNRPTISHDLSNIQLPKSFDAREVWSHCSTVNEIRDQSSCGSCWAFGAVEAMSDRLCIHSCGNTQVKLSALNLLACCESCGDGCYGGWPAKAWDYWKGSGLVSGGSLETPDGCLNYPFPSCTHHGQGTKPECREELYPTPKCKEHCSSHYNGTFSDDLHFAEIAYNIPTDEKQIMTEIMLNGPVEAAFEVFEDFETYESGIYFHAWGKSLGGHAIRLLGWGEENSVPYWILANSWNSEWGENGFFRILRGLNECGIESEVVAGLPKDSELLVNGCQKD